MKRNFLLASLLLCSMTAMRAEACYKECHIDDDKEMKRLTAPLKPTYLNDVVSTGGWASNWFLEVKVELLPLSVNRLAVEICSTELCPL